jgi:hypothetical protein
MENHRLKAKQTANRNGAITGALTKYVTGRVLITGVKAPISIARKWEGIGNLMLTIGAT